MPYDDGSSYTQFQDPDGLVTMITQFLARPENLSTSRLIDLTRVLHNLTGGKDVREIDTAKLAQSLKDKGLHNVPFNTVISLSQAVSKIGADKDVLAHMTLRDAQRIVSH